MDDCTPFIEHVTSADPPNCKDPVVFDVSADLTPQLFYERRQWPDLCRTVIRFLKHNIRIHPVIIGTRGSGKTAVVKYLLDIARAHALAHPLQDSQSPIATEPEASPPSAQQQLIRPFEYRVINCRDSNTSYKLVKALLGRAAYRGMPKFDAHNRVLQQFAASPHPHIIVLDEAQLLADYDFYYAFSRYGELANVLVISIANTLAFVKNMPPDIVSSFRHEFFLFDTYGGPELNAILLKRAEAGLQSYNRDHVLQIAAATSLFAGGDVRAGIAALERHFAETGHPGENATAETSARIDGIVQEEYDRLLLNHIRNLDANKLIVLYFCLRHRHTNDAYAEYQRRMARALSKFWFLRLVEELTHLTILTTTLVRQGRFATYQVHHVLGPRAVTMVENLLRQTALIPGLNYGTPEPHVKTIDMSKELPTEVRG